MTATAVLDAGGRALRVRAGGASSGPLLVGCHGTPDAAAMPDAWVAAAERLGVQLVTFDRPGYGGSDRRPGRVVADAADDVAAVLGWAGASSCAVWGFSGGGPHALAAAARLGPSVVTRVAAVASVAPFEAEGLNWFRGMAQANRIEVGAALWGLEAVTELLDAQVEELRALEADELAGWFDDVLGDADRAVVAEEAYVASWAASLPEVFAQGAAGWVDDDLATVNPWCFRLADVTVPALVWHGTDDRWVPADHGRWLAAQLPAAEPRLTDDGHLSLEARRLPDVFAWLAG